MYFGRFQQGQEVPLWVLCGNGSGAPTAPDAAPQADVYRTTLVVAGKAIPVLDPTAATGLFQGFLYLDESYPAGRYSVEFRWLISGTMFSSLASFEVVPGGDPTGQVIALARYHQPQADYLVQQRTSGRIFQGKNPRV